MLDGFDELLQATGVSQSDYLEKIALFQEREAVHGHPVAVIVTSRSAVADRARMPPGGAVSVRLEPFSDQQVTQWLQVWNEANVLFQAASEPAATSTPRPFWQAENWPASRSCC